MMPTGMNTFKIIERKWEKNSYKATSCAIVLSLKESLQSAFERHAWEWNLEICYILKLMDSVVLYHIIFLSASANRTILSPSPFGREKKK